MRKILDTASLKVRLTVGIAALAALSLASLSAWTSMRMQQIIVFIYKENMKYIASRFPKDVQKLLRNVYHELRTPLTIISGYI